LAKALSAATARTRLDNIQRYATKNGE